MSIDYTKEWTDNWQGNELAPYPYITLDDADRLYATIRVHLGPRLVLSFDRNHTSLDELLATGLPVFVARRDYRRRASYMWERRFS